MPNPKTWYIFNIRSGRELFLHELFVKAGYDVYTPFEKKYQRPTSRKARAERQPTVEYAEALFKGFLFVGSDLSRGETLLGFQYIIDRHRDAYSLMSHMGEPFALSDAMMNNWQAILKAEHSKRSNFVTRGYDMGRDRPKNRTRLFGQDAITLPKFTEGEVVRFLSGSFEGLTADVSSMNGEYVTVLMTIFGQIREVADVDAYELQKVG